MATTELTHRRLSGLAQGDYFDTKETGLVCRAYASGKRTFFFVYQLGTRRVWMRLGAWPALGLSEARELVRAQRPLVDAGRDPATEAREAKLARLAPPPPPPQVVTVADMVGSYLEAARRKKRTWRDDELKLQRYVLPNWGTRAIADIRRSDVYDLLNAASKGTLPVQGARPARPLAAGVNRLHAVISRLFSHAVNIGRLESHPARKLEKLSKEDPRERLLTDEELRTLWQGLQASTEIGADAITLRLLTGQRGGEVAGMTWAEIDFDAATWTMAHTRTKNGDQHVVPLAPLALGVLTRRRGEREDLEGPVFPGYTLQTEGHKRLRTLRTGDFTWKDLRRTMTTRLAESGVRAEVLGALLNHRAVSVLARHYNKADYLPEKRAALELWERELLRIVEGLPAQRTVVRFPKRAR